MTTEIRLPTPVPEPVLPTAEQHARLEARRRYNLLHVYLPLGLVALLWLITILALLWLTVVGKWFAVDTDQERFRALVSGVADAVTILMLLPCLLLCLLPLGGAAGVFVWRRRRGADAPDVQESLPLFWRIENVISRVQAPVVAFLPKLAQPIVVVYGLAAFVRTFLQQLKEIIRREINRYVG